MASWVRTLGIFGGFAVVVAAAFYPIYFRPLLLPEEYKKEQRINRAGIVQEDIQPAG
ncbi:SIM20 protein, partial [Psilopogon haemacephalus]|nr:SIM20 protein [Psilopogon haemacephalus]